MKFSTIYTWLRYCLISDLAKVWYSLKHFYYIKIRGYPDCSEPVWDWFELSYAQYLTVPRSILQSMHLKWQKKFVKLMEELDDTIDWRPKTGRYWVQLKDSKGRYVQDSFMQYRHVNKSDIPFKK